MKSEFILQSTALLSKGPFEYLQILLFSMTRVLTSRTLLFGPNANEQRDDYENTYEDLLG